MSEKPSYTAADDSIDQLIAIWCSIPPGERAAVAHPDPTLADLLDTMRATDAALDKIFRGPADVGS